MSVAGRIASPFRVGVAHRFALACAMLGAMLLGPTANATQSLTFVMQPFPPFAFEEEGKIKGAFPEVVSAVCEAMKVNCQIAAYPWRRALRLAESGSADGILVIQKMDDREESFFLTEPLMYSSYGLYAHESSGLQSVSASQLAGYTVGAYGPSATARTAADMLKSAPTARLEMEIDNLTVLKKLGAQRYGEKGAAVVNVDVANYLIKQDRLTRLRLVGEIRQIEYMIGLSRRSVSAPLAQRFQTALRRLRDNGTLQKIAEKYGLRGARPAQFLSFRPSVRGYE